MSRRRKLLGLGGLLLLVALVFAVAYRRAQTAPAVVSVPEAPPVAQETALAVLAAAGYQAVSAPAWAGPEPGWQAPGEYRLLFAASSQDQGVEVYSAHLWVDAQGQVSRLGRVERLTDTPAGEESAPVLGGDWAAFATRVGDYFQSVTCVDLNENRREVFAFQRPVEMVTLNWRSVPGHSPVLEVIAADAEGESTMALDAVARRVEPEGANLEYLPVAHGEQAWLPALVSRVRELPGVGPEKIAFLENVFFMLADKVTRLRHSSPPPAVPQPLPTSSPTPAKPVATLAPVIVEETLTPTTLPTLTATPTLTPIPAGELLADGIVWRGSVKPDPQRPYADVEVVEIDPALLQIKMIPGTHEPRPSTGLLGTGVIPREDWPALVAGFNGGFAAMHGQYGMMVDRKVYLPARDGIATLAVYEDGSLRMGTWGTDLVQTPDMVSYRQNCPPLIVDGVITAETGKLTLWGLSVANEVYLYRSGLGLTRDGRLVYVAGKPLSAYTLARALQMAGAEYAMQLDVDEYHVAFFTYVVQPNPDGGDPTITAEKLRSDMRGFDGFFLRPFQLDFFYLLRRPEPLVNGVRVAPTPQAPGPTPTLASYDLPGQLAFASERDGNWELYSMQPGRPDSVQRLTDHPADDLYPAWSDDGRQIAFASRRDGNAEVYVMDVAARAVRRVTYQDSEEWAPAWSPNGSSLAYQSDRNGQSDIYVCPVGGGDELRLTPMEGNHEAPDWSPDGQRFVFDSDLDVAELVHASINLYFMEADGSNHRRFLSGAESPRWSPDGKTIAFNSRRTGYWQVFLVNADGSGLRQLTRGRYDARYPAWSPDGQWIAFAGNEEGHWELYAIPVQGGEPMRLTAGSGDSTYPSWGP